jgi:hypothetical protein
VQAPAAGLDLEARIVALVAEHRPELEQLVDQALQAAIDGIVTERLNGNGKAVISPTAATVNTPMRPVTKVCNRCTVMKPIAEFERGRGVCRECRRHEQRARGRRPVQEPPHAVAGGGDSLAAAPARRVD